MKPLSTYIEYLLMTRHYAFVPGLGGFMFQEVPSQITQDGRLTPPSRIIKFNRFLDHDDGMLANVMMRSEALSYDEIIQAIRISVAEILNKVQHQEHCQLGRLGSIFVDADSHVSFEAATRVDNDPVHFGLASVKFQHWQDVEAARKAETISEPTQEVVSPAPAPIQASATKRSVSSTKPRINHHDGIVELPTRWLRRAAIVLLVVSFIIANMIPWSTTHDGMHFANLIDTGSLLRRLNIFDPVVLPADKATATLIEGSDSSSISATSVAQVTDSVNIQASSAPVAEATPAPASTDSQQTTKASSTSSSKEKPSVSTTASFSTKQYLVIVGSCTSLSEAERLVRRLRRKGIEGLEIYDNNNGRYRVYIDSFTKKKEAVSYLDQLRATTQFKDAWVLAVRPSSHPLSYNKKIKDNDQLPMELSHHIRSAERDQG